MDSFVSEFLELRKDSWDSVGDDFMQNMMLSPQEEQDFLSSHDANLGEYLKLHPEMAHELMVPSGSKERIPRRYERLLANIAPLYKQTGLNKEADRNGEILAEMMKGPLKVLNRPNGVGVPEWYEAVWHVHENDVEASQYEHKVTGDLVRVFQFKDLMLQVPETDWRLMRDHVACHFTELPFWDPVGLECFALHLATCELKAIGSPWWDWYFPVGQEIEICLLQIDARLGAIHRRNMSHKCYGNPERHLHLGYWLKEFLTKEQAAACILDQRIQLGLPIKACNYDRVVMDLLNLKHGPNGCGIMVPKDNSPSRIRDLVLQALDIRATPALTDIPLPTMTPEKDFAAKELNHKIKKEKIESDKKSPPPDPRPQVVEGFSTCIENQKNVKMRANLFGNPCMGPKPGGLGERRHHGG